MEPSEYGTLMMDEQITGMWTQRNKLRDADVPYLYRKYYSASRFDSILDGINREISPSLTSVRRPGSSRYNTNLFPGIDSFTTFKWLQDGAQQLRVLADGQDGVIYDATAGQKSVLFTKSAGAGRARYKNVGPTLYLGDGVDTLQIVRSAVGWQANKTFSEGQFIIDTNLNVQRYIPSQTATITNIQVVDYTKYAAPAPPVVGSMVTLFFSSAQEFSDIVTGMQIALAGLTTVAALNGQTLSIDSVYSSQQVNVFVHPPLTPQAYATETGTAATGNGQTGGTQPVWNSNLGAVTIDGGAQWTCRGFSTRPWGYAGPTTAPTVTQVDAPTLYGAWEASTWFGPAIVLVDTNGNVQQLTQSGETGASQPTWSTTVGAVTTDNTAAWTNRGSSAWAGNTAVAVGKVIVVQFTYYITTYQSIPYPPYYEKTVTPQTVTLAFICDTAGTTGNNQPNWSNGNNTIVQDGTVVWRCIGNPLTWATIGANAFVSTKTQIHDSNGNVQTAQFAGKTGSVAPTWKTNVGDLTADGTAEWINGGPYSAANTGAWIYSYSGKDTVTRDVTTESPASLPITQDASKQIVIQGLGLDARMDTIIIWRTPQGKSTRVYLDQFPNPGPNNTWIYTDTTPDTPSNGSPGLNALIAAPTDDANDPPPSTATAPEYHCGRMWVIDGFYIRYSDGPDTLVGNGNNTFPPNNYWLLPEQPIKLKSITVTNGGLLIMGQVNVYIIMGEGTSSSPFLPPKIYAEKVGISLYESACMVGATLYAFTNTRKVIRFDPANGYEEIGFPIGDQFEKLTTGGFNASIYAPGVANVVWHETSSGDTGLYVADGAVGWFRWSPITPPETGSLWSPFAAIVGGTSAVQSIETSPGQFQLLIGPPNGTSASGPILYRDKTVKGDWNAGDYQGYPSWWVLGSIAMAETGEVAELAHISLQSLALGARPTVSLLLDEIQAGVTVDGQTTAWDQLALEDRHEDPPNLEPSITLYSDRYKTSSTAECPKCMHFQMKIDYGTQQVADELLKFAIYGAVFKERKQQ